MVNQSLVFLDREDVLRIHRKLEDDFADSNDPILPPGLRDEGLLDSAISRQHVGSDKALKYPTIAENAATLLYGLCMNHAFHNGNKRTALVSMLAHLDSNKQTLRGTNQKQLFDLMISVATHAVGLSKDPRVRRKQIAQRRSADFEVAQVAAWIDARMYRVTRGEKEISYRELNRILDRFGYELQNPKKSFIEVVRRVKQKRGIVRREETTALQHVTTIPFPGMKRPVAIRHLKHVREACRLREEDGVDSRSFYDEDAVIDSFINEYRTVLRRLARR